MLDGEPPEAVVGGQLDAQLPGSAFSAQQVRAFDPRAGTWYPAPMEDGRVLLSDFRRSLVIRVDRQ